MQTVIDATQKEAAIDQQYSCETLICLRHQTILRLLSSAATASTRWRVHELNCPTMYLTVISICWIIYGERVGILEGNELGRKCKDVDII